MESDAVDARGLSGLRVVAFESRRAAEIAELIRRHGGEPLTAPAMCEVAVSENSQAADFLQDLDNGKIDIVILMTGVGLRMLLDAVAGEWPRERVTAALQKATLVARGPKPGAALRELGVRPNIVVPEPNTWREILLTLDQQVPLSGRRVVVQEYGVTNDALLNGLRQQGAIVQNVAVYRWALPDDTSPLRQAVEEICAGKIDVVMFTSATQVYHLLQVAGQRRDELCAALRAVAVASIGPVCSQALLDHDIKPAIEPAHSKMGQLVREVAMRARQVLEDKRPLAQAIEAKEENNHRGTEDAEAEGGSTYLKNLNRKAREVNNGLS